MRDLIQPLIREAQALTLRAARRLGSEAEPQAAHFRFRPDGLGGVLATPFPNIAGLDSAALAGAVPAGSALLAPPYASGDWLAFDPSPQWSAQVRRADWENLTLSPEPAPPIPCFPARIDPLLWRLDTLMGITDPMIAARLDRGNPAWQVLRARALARSDQGGCRPDRELVCLAALLSQSQGDASALAVQAGALTRRYLSQPGEDALVAQCLGAVLAAVFTKNSPQETGNPLQ